MSKLWTRDFLSFRRSTMYIVRIGKVRLDIELSEMFFMSFDLVRCDGRFDSVLFLRSRLFIEQWSSIVHCSVFAHSIPNA